MRARWLSFWVGLALLLAPLAFGYERAALILHDVALGTLACVAALAALGRPALRYAQLAPGAWLVLAPRLLGERGACAAVETVSGVALLLLAGLPGGKLASARRPARMTA